MTKALKSLNTRVAIARLVCRSAVCASSPLRKIYPHAASTANPVNSVSGQIADPPAIQQSPAGA